MDFYLGQILMFAFSDEGFYPPTGFLPCDGRTLQINQYDALFALINITYGGDGVTTFALPDLRGVFPIGAGTNPANSFQANAGQRGGSYSVATSNYSVGTGDTVINLPTQGRPISTMPPYLAVNFAICVSGGVFPVNNSY